MFEDYCLYVRTETPSVDLQFGGFITRSTVNNLDSNNFTLDMIDQAIGRINRSLGVPSYVKVELFGIDGSGGWSLEEEYV